MAASGGSWKKGKFASAGAGAFTASQLRNLTPEQRRVARAFNALLNQQSNYQRPFAAPTIGEVHSSDFK